MSSRFVTVPIESGNGTRDIATLGAKPRAEQQDPLQKWIDDTRKEKCYPTQLLSTAASETRSDGKGQTCADLCRRRPRRA
ncbi:MAG: hypothetical protein ACI93T_000320 [Porticoccaceae bacterium]|jgi:hypothetical protein